MIRSSLAAVPSRVPVVAAKAAVFGAVTLVAMVASSFGAFLAAQAFLGYYGHATSLTDSGVLRVVIGTGVYLTLIGLLGAALGWLLRSTPGGITAFAGLILVLPGLLQVLPGTWGQTVAHYLPEQAGESFIMSVRDEGALEPWTGIGRAGAVGHRRDGRRRARPQTPRRVAPTPPGRGALRHPPTDRRPRELPRGNRRRRNRVPGIQPTGSHHSTLPSAGYTSSMGTPPLPMIHSEPRITTIHAVTSVRPHPRESRSPTGGIPKPLDTKPLRRTSKRESKRESLGTVNPVPLKGKNPCPLK